MTMTDDVKKKLEEAKLEIQKEGDRVDTADPQELDTKELENVSGGSVNYGCRNESCAKQ